MHLLKEIQGFPNYAVLLQLFEYSGVEGQVSWSLHMANMLFVLLWIFMDTVGENRSCEGKGSLPRLLQG